MMRPQKSVDDWGEKSQGSNSIQPKAALLDENFTNFGLPCGSAGKEFAWDVGDLGSVPGWEDPPEKGKATHFSILAWRIPWTV